jgi:hypothetical protein
MPGNFRSSEENGPVAGRCAEAEGALQSLCLVPVDSKQIFLKAGSSQVTGKMLRQPPGIKQNFSAKCIESAERSARITQKSKRVRWPVRTAAEYLLYLRSIARKALTAPGS